MPEDPLAVLTTAASQAMGRRDVRGAAAHLSQAVALAPERPVLWLSLAAAQRAAGELAEATMSVERALKSTPRDFVALLMRASLLERTHGRRTAGPAYGAALAQAPAEPALDAPTRRALQHAREVNAAYSTDMHAALHAALEPVAGGGAAARRSAMFVDLLTGRRRRYDQQPIGYFYPGLPAVAFWERDAFPWLEALERQTAAIAAEMLAVGYEDAALIPYIDFAEHEPLDQWAELNRSPQWTAFHLIRHGRRLEENCHRCPATLAALAQTPQPVAVDRSPSAMFSILKPHTRIPPHTGVSNTRLVVHLPLSVPPGCGFRVGDETRAWRQGEAWVFDDTIEHEAWNDSPHPRGVLIFDVWNPLIRAEEREAIGRIMSALDSFNAAPAEDL